MAYCGVVNPERVREKWAGADSNCGYGHPKAEGYQATPPARTRRKGAVSFNASESTNDVDDGRTVTAVSPLEIPISVPSTSRIEPDATPGTRVA